METVSHYAHRPVRKRGGLHNAVVNISVGRPVKDKAFRADQDKVVQGGESPATMIHGLVKTIERAALYIAVQVVRVRRVAAEVEAIYTFNGKTRASKADTEKLNSMLTNMDATFPLRLEKSSTGKSPASISAESSTLIGTVLGGPEKLRPVNPG